MRNKDHDQHVDTIEDAEKFAEHCHIEHINIDISKHEDNGVGTDNQDNLPQAGTGPGKDGVEGTKQLDDNYDDPWNEEMSSKIIPSHIVLTEAIHCQSQGNKEEYGQNYHIVSLDVQ